MSILYCQKPSRIYKICYIIFFKRVRFLAQIWALKAWSETLRHAPKFTQPKLRADQGLVLMMIFRIKWFGGWITLLHIYHVGTHHINWERSNFVSKQLSQTFWFSQSPYFIFILFIFGGNPHSCRTDIKMIQNCKITKSNLLSYSPINICSAIGIGYFVLGAVGICHW